MLDEANTQEIVLVPVDENGRVLLFTDVKIEKVDRDFRTIRGPEGLTWKLKPGEYTVRIFLRNLQMKTIPLTVTPGVSNYRVAVETAVAPAESFAPSPPPPQTVEEEMVQPDKTPGTAPPDILPEEAIQETKNLSDSDERKRFPVTFPVSYRTDSGKWVEAKALNVSTTGLCVENLARVMEEDNLYVKLHVPVATIPIECPARVVWVKSKNSRTPCMGLQLFLTSNMRDSLDRWLSEI